MALATFEAFYSRPIAPTRRVALGDMFLPDDPAPGFAGVLLGGIMARYARHLDAETDEGVDDLIDDLEAGRHVGQPRLRHRLQHDRVGLARCRHRLVADGERVRYSFDMHVGTPTQHVVCAAYAAASCRGDARSAIFASLRKGLLWVGPIDDSLVRFLADRRFLTAGHGSDPTRWAGDLLGVDPSEVEAPGGDRHALVARAFRERLLLAHPDHGGPPEHAAERISELREARRILMGR